MKDRVTISKKDFADLQSLARRVLAITPGLGEEPAPVKGRAPRKGPASVMRAIERRNKRILK